MKKFLAVYTGSAKARQDSGWDALDPDERNRREQQSMTAWSAWMDKYAAVVLDSGGLLGRTKQVTKRGVTVFKIL